MTTHSAYSHARGRATTDDIVAAAVGIADRDGLEAGVVRFYDRVLEALSEGGFDGAEAVYAFDTLLMFLFGSVLWQIPRADTERERLIQIAVAPPQQTPRLVEAAGQLGRRNPEQYFENGLSTIIAGLDAELGEPRRRCPTRGTGAPCPARRKALPTGPTRWRGRRRRPPAQP